MFKLRSAAFAAAAIVAASTFVAPAQAQAPISYPAQSVQATAWELSFSAHGITSKYHVITSTREGKSVDWSKPVGMVIRLHGDGGYEYVAGRRGGGYELAEKAIAHNMIVLIPRTPDTLTMTWWQGDRDAHGAWVTALVDSMLKSPRYPNLNAGDLTWMGYSGGAEFISLQMLPNRTQYLTSGALMVGGGTPPWTGGAEATKKASERQLAEVPVKWVVGSEDIGLVGDGFNAVRAAKRGVSTYCGGQVTTVSSTKTECSGKSKGFAEAALEVQPGRDHYNVDHPKVLAEFLPTRKPAETTTDTPSPAPAEPTDEPVTRPTDPPAVPDTEPSKSPEVPTPADSEPEATESETPQAEPSEVPTSEPEASESESPEDSPSEQAAANPSDESGEKSRPGLPKTGV